MKLRNRLAKLEQARPAQRFAGVALDLPPDLYARIEAALDAGTYPGALSNADLLAIMRGFEAAGVQT
ncbi:MAG: hypothetical protein LAT81_13920 [Oceanicaulis sp.]|nr:hypothetical protein [Oceanicaulis sp.]